MFFFSMALLWKTSSGTFIF